MARQTKRLAVSLTRDMTLYPRVHVDEVHEHDLVRALLAGDTLPPIVIDKKSGVIVDGVHRCGAHIKAFGDDVQVAVDERSYKSRAEMFLDAVQLNSQHGRKLDRQDEVRIINMARQFDFEDKVIAVSLHIPEQRVITLAPRVVYDEAKTFYPLKRGLSEWEGQKVTAEQVQTNKSVRTGSLLTPAREIIRLINSGLAAHQLEREEVAKTLSELLETVQRALQIKV